MIGLIQRVKYAKVSVAGETIGQIDAGILLLLGVEKGDNADKVKKLAKKVAMLRIFPDTDDKMNLSLSDTHGELLVVSQFTLAADTSKGNRPGFSNSAEPALGKALFDEFVTHYNQSYRTCQSGRFGANMQVELLNDGPATFTLKV